MNDRKCLLIRSLLFVLVSFGSLSPAAQTVSRKFEGELLKNVLKEVERQTDLSIIYKKDEVNERKKITATFQAAPVETVLAAVLDADLCYNVQNRMIVISRKNKLQLYPNGLQKTIRGQVVDKNGEPLIGANVQIAGRNRIGAVTDATGRFVLPDVPADAVLRISYMGFKSATVKATDTVGQARIVLLENEQLLDEVVVVGYGTQKKVNLTGAVSVVAGDRLASRSGANLSQLLQGTVPNLVVSFESGRPGQTGNFNIRGVNSISADAAPLVIVDGIEGDINKVNPNDVESISVLKDASAAAVYGARAAYGVILVTTKNGREGKAAIRYSGRFSISDITTSTDFETRGYYSAGIVDMFYKTYQGVPYTRYTQEDYHELWIRRNDRVEDPSRPWVVEKNNKYNYYGNFDWYHALFDHTRPTWEHNLTVSGGNKKVNYLVSGNFYKQKGVIRVDPDRYKKYTFRSKINAELASWLEFSNNTAYYHSDYTYPGTSGIDNIFARSGNHALASIVPIHPDGTLVYRTGLTDTGEVGDGISAVLFNGGHRNRDREYEFVTTFEAVLKPVRQVEIRANYSFARYDKQTRNRSVDVYYSRDPGETVLMDIGRTNGNYLAETSTEQQRHSFNLYGSYEQSLGRAHAVKAVAGANYEYKYSKSLSMRRNGLLTDNLDDFNLAKGEDITLTGGQNDYAILGFFYRVNYGYADRYLFEASGRYDGSSRFRRGHRFGFFPSFSAAWRISEEPFYAGLREYMNYLKLRLSYGSLGNQKTVGYYDYMQLIRTEGVLNYAFGDATKGSYAYETAPNSADQTWETVVSKNLGLDLAFLNNRLQISADAYIRDTRDMLMAGKTLPGVYGAASPRMNVADLRTRGWELSVSWNHRFLLADRPFEYRVTAGVGDNTSEVTRYDNPNRTLTDPYKGQRLGEIWGYVVDGYFRSDDEAARYPVDQSFVNQIIDASALDNGLHAGDLKFADLDGNKKIEPTTSANEMKDMKVIGNSLPRYNYSFGFSAGWRGIDLSAFFQGIGRQDWYPGAECRLFWGPYTRPYCSFIPSDFMSRVWSENNPDAYFPRPRGYVALNNNRELSVVNTRYLQNLAYCRLKNLSVGYTLPEKWLSRVGFEKIRIYFTGENLLTFSKLHSDYIDPEQASAGNTWRSHRGDANIYPWPKTFSFGVDVVF